VKSYKSSSTERPPEWDKTSSPGSIYHNYNVVEVPATDENPPMFHYDVDEYEPLEYIKIQDQQIDNLKTQTDLLTECVLEMSEAVYA